MALSLQKISSEGFTTEYHKISNASVRENTLTCSVDSYVSKDYRELERPADHSFFHFDITVEEEESMGIRQLCYKKIKELPEWANAIDC